MPVDRISTIKAELAKLLQGQGRNSVPLTASPLANVSDPVAVANAATENLTSAQQEAILGAEAMQTLNREPASPAEPLLDDGTRSGLATVLDSEGMSPARQAALAANETVQAAAAGLELNPAQGAALTVNQALETLTTAPPEARSTPLAAAALTADQPPPAATGPLPAAATPPARAGEAAAPATAATTTEAAGREEARTGEGIAIPRQATMPTPQYGNAAAVYEVRNPAPPPGEPIPVRRDVRPTLPAGRARRIDPSVLRQEWEKWQTGRNRPEAPRTEAAGETAESRPALAEKAIRQMVQQANDDLAASGVPLQLVLARNEEGYIIDVYNCADGETCKIEQEVPVDLGNLLTTLDNLQHEQGIIINIRT